MKPEGVYIVVNFTEGPLAVMFFVTNDHRTGGVLRDSSDEAIGLEILKTFWNRTPTGFRRILASDVPVNFESAPQFGGVLVSKAGAYREAWADDGTNIIYNMPKAKEIHRNILRHEREALLEKLDKDVSRALVVKDDVTSAVLETERQKLRDLPQDPRIEAAVSVSELKALTIDEILKSVAFKLK